MPTYFITMIDFIFVAIETAASLIIIVAIYISLFSIKPETCEDGEPHDYKLIKERYVKGENLGMSHSFTSLEYECTKCKKRYDTIS